jgi:hypothetical protein
VHNTKSLDVLILIEIDHKMLKEHMEKKDWNGVRTLSKLVETTKHRSHHSHVKLLDQNEIDTQYKLCTIIFHFRVCLDWRMVEWCEGGWGGAT